MGRKSVASKKKVLLKGGRSVKDYFPAKSKAATTNSVDPSNLNDGDVFSESVDNEATTTETVDKEASNPETADKEATKTEPAVPRRVSPRTKTPVDEDVLPKDVEEPSTKKRRVSTVTDNKDASSIASRKGSPHRKCGKDYDTLVTRMSPSLIINFIKSNPSEKQVEAIQSMGFGELLKLQSEVIHGHLARWIVESFNPFSCSLMNGDLTITDEDVYLVTGIPMGPLDINPVGRNLL
ncbi:uncharacterized protein LOC141613299 [Silene latifolia]|uniref:uncharacterized protein LOC141613299 n=1 Tax=Silene latifolia TaxID=37657 RepID=UPI003D76C275